MKNIPKNNRFTVRCNDHQTALLNRYQRDLDDDGLEATANTIKSLIEEIPANGRVKSGLENAKKKIKNLEKRDELNCADFEERLNQMKTKFENEKTEIIRLLDSEKNRHIVEEGKKDQNYQALKKDFEEYKSYYNLFNALNSNLYRFSLSCSMCMKTHFVTVTPGIIDAIMISLNGDWVYVDNRWYCRTCAEKRLEMPTLNDVDLFPLFPR